MNLWSKMMKKLYDWVMRMVSGPKAMVALCMVSFAESSFFPIPPDLLLIPMVLKEREKAFRIALYCTLFSVIGGVFGYAIGHFLYETLGIPILDFYNYRESFEKFCENYNVYGAWIVFGAGLTPFPYKIITIASGVTGLNFGIFMLASVLARGLRFYLVSVLLWKWGQPMKIWIEKNLWWLSILFFVCLVGGFYLVKYL